MLTNEEKITNYETMLHIEKVRNYINKIISLLLLRAENHDQSKLCSPEVEYFAKHTEKLANTTFGSNEYNKCKKEMQVALDHHYANNRHHPEHHKNGVDDMNLVDLLEMLIDWKSSSERHNDGNIRKSLEINAERFNFSPQLTKIFENTIKQLF
jgi:hypothetical protein